MTVSALSGSDQTSLIRQLLASLQTSTTSAPGDDDPVNPAGPAQGAGSSAIAPPPPPLPRPDTAGSDRFSADTLSSLLQAQQQPSASDVASKLITDSDTDGSGTLSLDEVTKALSGASSNPAASSSSAIQDGFSKLDTNGDGQLSQDELTTGLQKQGQARHGHHHHAHYAAAASSTTSAMAADPTSTTSDSVAATAATDVTA